jgi:hypothetical protein
MKERQKAREEGARIAATARMRKVAEEKNSLAVGNGSGERFVVKDNVLTLEKF